MDRPANSSGDEIAAGSWSGGIGMKNDRVTNLAADDTTTIRVSPMGAVLCGFHRIARMGMGEILYAGADAAGRSNLSGLSSSGRGVRCWGGIKKTKVKHMGPREYDCEDMPGGNGPPIEAASVYHDDLLKMLAIADDGPVVLSPSGKAAIRWALSMLNVLGDQIAVETGLPIPVVLERASKTVEQSEEFNWPA
jgi:hypothetical protein